MIVLVVNLLLHRVAKPNREFANDSTISENGTGISYELRERRSVARVVRTNHVAESAVLTNSFGLKNLRARAEPVGRNYSRSFAQTLNGS